MCYKKDYYQEDLNTWAKWVDSNVTPKKTTVFFGGYSASHFRFTHPYYELL
jgi:hypothetical protein